MPERLAPPESHIFSISPSTLDSLQNGSTQAWEAFYKQCRGPWISFAVHRGMSHEAAADVVNTTVAKLHRRLCGKDFTGNPTSYAWKAFTNTYRSERRKQNRNVLREEPVGLFQDAPGEEMPHVRVPATDDNLDRIDSEPAKLVQTLFDSNMRDRDKGILRQLARDPTHEEMVDYLGLEDKPNMASVLVSRAKQRAREVLARSEMSAAS